MLKAFQEHISRQFPYLKNSKIIVACSGGIDSIILTHLCLQSGLDIALAHCNFKMRGAESEADEEFVKNLGLVHDIPVYVKHLEAEKYGKIKRLSIQMAAREMRYEWFQSLVEEKRCDYVFTAHHNDDNLETFLINLSRGTGIDGLTGIPTVNEPYIRPLLPFSRNELVNFAKAYKIDWREDSSNKHKKYLRNKLRHDVIPLLKEINPSLLENFKKTVGYLTDSATIILDSTHSLKKELFEYQTDHNTIIHISIAKIVALGNVRAYLYVLLKDFGFTSWDDIVLLLQAQTGKYVNSSTHRLIKDRSHLLLAPLTATNQIQQYQIFEGESAIILPHKTLKIKKVTAFQNVDVQTLYVDANILIYPLLIRKWQEGDSFYPLGMKGKKKLSKFFKDEKLSLLDKENVWVLCSNDQIVWIIGYRADERFKVTSKTTEIMKFSIRE